ncbi:hypothetical protein A2U01_0117256, partial [Trifolium medium]|nr:hypothetical protein [Trifolium medium]
MRYKREKEIEKASVVAAATDFS